MLCVESHLYFCHPDRKYKHLLRFFSTFSCLGADPAVLRQFNTSLIVLEAVWELHMVTTALLSQWEKPSQQIPAPLIDAVCSSGRDFCL